MKITRVAITNLLAYPSAEIALDRPVTLVLGLNETGKTSLSRAIEAGLTGSVMALASLPLEELIRTGAASGAVTLTLTRPGSDKPVEITRMLSPRGSTTKVNGHATTKGVYDFFCPEGLAQPEAVLRVLCNATGFFEFGAGAKGAERQKELLLALVDQSVPPALVADLPVDSSALTPIPHPRTLAEVTAAYQTAYDRRAAVNRALVALRTPEAPRPPAALPDIAAIRRKLAELDAEERRLVEAAAEARGRRDTLTRQRAAALESRDQAAIRLEELGPLDAAESEVASLGQMVAQEKAASRRPRGQMPMPTEVIDMAPPVGALVTLASPTPAFVAPAMPVPVPSVPATPHPTEREAPEVPAPALDHMVCPLAHHARCALMNWQQEHGAAKGS